MEKTETIHVRVDPEIKRQSEEVLNELGLNMSYAISMFLKQVIIRNKIPFEISKYCEEETEEEKLIYALNSTGGGEVDKESKDLIHLYATHRINYETLCFALDQRFAK